VTDAGAALAGNRVLITGGLGLIGSNLARTAARTAGSVVVLDVLVSEHGGNRQNLEPHHNVEVIEQDLRDAAALPALLDGVDVVFNLAGQRSHSDSMLDPLTDLEHNCRAQLTLLEACRRAARKPTVVFASTRQVYGRPQRQPVDETHPVAPLDVNGIHKAAAERYHTLYHEIYGLPTTVLRLTNTYGPGMRVSDSRQGFLGAWVEAVIRDRVFEVWGGRQRRDLCYVDDAVEAFLLAAVDARLRGGTYNLGALESATLREIADLLIALNGSGDYVVREMPADAAAIDIGDYVADDAAFRTLTGWQPRVSLEDGLARTLSYYRAHGSHYWAGS
jgi:UDP-glucose 4-epimerase